MRRFACSAVAPFVRALRVISPLKYSLPDSPNLQQHVANHRPVTSTLERDGDACCLLLLPAACFMLLAACCLLPATCCLLPAACSLLLAACCLLLAACCLLLAVRARVRKLNRITGLLFAGGPDGPELRWSRRLATTQGAPQHKISIPQSDSELEVLHSVEDCSLLLRNLGQRSRMTARWRTAPACYIVVTLPPTRCHRHNQSKYAPNL